MKTRLINLMIVAALLCLALPACSRASSIPPAATGVTTPVEITLAPTWTETTAPEPTLTPSPQPVAVEPSITPTPAPTAIQHITQPDNPVYVDLQKVADCTMNKNYFPGQPMTLVKSCDSWPSYIERPMTADLKTYLPYLDIQEIQFGSKGDWIYARIRPYDVVPQVGDGDLFYALELDQNFDGLNDVLVSVQNLSPSSVVWTVNGVRAWKFVDGKVTQIFDQGVGADPDMVWVRRVPQSKTIEFAFKIAMLDGDISFAWWAWAYQGEIDPTELIPVVAFADRYQVDNTCAMGFNGSRDDLLTLLNVCR